jgi:putative ABC transport system permease protein
VVLSLFGGVVGILLGLGAAVAGARMMNVPFIPNLEIILVAVLFSGAVGVIFGFFPARKAARLDPIDALRHE